MVEITELDLERWLDEGNRRYWKLHVIDLLNGEYSIEDFRNDILSFVPKDKRAHERAQEGG